MKQQFFAASLLLLSVQGQAQPPTPNQDGNSKISINASQHVNRITPWLYGACIEDVNHEIYGGLYDQQIFGESFEEPAIVANFKHFTTFGGVWQMKQELLHVLPSPGAQLMANDFKVTDGAVELDMKFNSTQGSFAGLIVRLNNPGVGADNFDGYEISLAADGKRVVFGKHEHNWQPIKDIVVKFDPLAWNLLRVEMRGEELCIILNGKELFRYKDPETKLRSGQVSIRNWDADLAVRSLTVANPTPKRISFTTTARPSVSWMWEPFKSEGAIDSYSHQEAFAQHGQYAQRVDHRGGRGEVGIINRGLNHWGIAVRKGSPMHGLINLREATAPVMVSLRSADGKRIYASQLIDTKRSGQWTKHSFTLTPDSDDPTAAFFASVDIRGGFTADMVTLMNDPLRQFKGLPLRGDIAELLANQGLTMLRYGGTMVNARDYRFKPMTGVREQRPPYTGHWYPYSTNGFGIVEFAAFCQVAGLEPSFAINIEEDPQDMADMIEYLNGAASSVWGRKRVQDGFAKPFGIRYIEIGNEEMLHADDPAGYDHYVKRFLLISEAMRRKDRSLKIICAAWWRPESKSMERVFKALDGKADYWDYHPWTDAIDDPEKIDAELTQMREMFTSWNPATTMKCVIFEENGVRHDMQRAIVHAKVQNVIRRHGDFVLATCAANALQPYKQNDNGWDQGQIFFTPDRAWGQPTYYAQQLSSANHAELLVNSSVDGSGSKPDVTATLTDDGRSLILHVVNTSLKPAMAELEITGFTPSGQTTIYTLSGAPGDENIPEAPDQFATKVRWVQASSGMKLNLDPFSYTVVRFNGER